MRVKLTVTTECGARCKTCPVWKTEKRTMRLAEFKRVIAILNAAPQVEEIFLNSTGDLYALPDHIRYLVHLETNKQKFVSLTTNANVLDHVPCIDHLTISFNGGDRASYEYTTGLDFERVVGNIRAAYPQIIKAKYREIDCLVWKGNEGCEAAFFELWKDFPGAARVSYKVENQFGEYFGLPVYWDDRRVPCDYLDGLTIMPDGQCVRCAHDFHAVDDYGNIFADPIEKILAHPARVEIRQAHAERLYPGICERCNYNVSSDGKLIYRRP